MENDSQRAVCVDCGAKKAPLSCGVCVNALCKSCAHFIEEEQFSFLAIKPEELAHTTYCQSCYTKHVEPAILGYEETMKKAREILVFEKKQGKETRLIRRIEDPVTVSDCEDYNETVLRLAFFAAQKGKNAIVDLEVKSKKVRTGSYQTSRYSGTAVPADVRDDKLIKDRSLWQNPN